MPGINYDEKVPNNVSLSTDKGLQRAVEGWLGPYGDWWEHWGPVMDGVKGLRGAIDKVYLRTAVSADRAGWAEFGYVKPKDYRWGIFLKDPVPDRKIGFGDHMGQPVWQEVPGEFRNMLRRIITTQGDTEPGSVEQQRDLTKTAPSLHDLRSLLQVNAEEGRHLWAMVYLLHAHFQKDGREEAVGLLERHSGDPDKPRTLGAFNIPIKNWVDFFMFTMFTDRDGKYQLASLAESGFDPLSRTCRFMLEEEAHHLLVGHMGITRMIERTCELMEKAPDGDVTKVGGIPLSMIQKFINKWVSCSEDLFGSEISSNAADFFSAGVKGRYKEGELNEHKALGQTHPIDQVVDGVIQTQRVDLRNAMNAVLLDAYVRDCQKAVNQWNKIICREGSRSKETGFTLRLPHPRFNRYQGIYRGHKFDIDGNPMESHEWERRQGEWLPTAADDAYVNSLMVPEFEPGKFAGWIAPPSKGVNGKPVDHPYVLFEEREAA